MMSGRIALWAAMSGLALFDFIVCRALGLRFTNWLLFLSAAGGIAVLGLVYGLTRRSLNIAGMANAMLLWMIGSLLGAILTYAALAQAGQVYDAQLAAADAALGFDWAAWHQFVSSYPIIKVPLELAYTSLLPQIVLSVIWFSILGREDRNAELLTNFLLGLLVTTAISHLLPALGPCAELPACRQSYADELNQLRSLSLPPVDITRLTGLVVFPSFHTVLAILFTYAHRRLASFLPIALLNGVMLLAIPSEGGHYLVDLLAGGAVAGVCIVATSALVRGRRVSLRLTAKRWPSSFRPEQDVPVTAP